MIVLLSTCHAFEIPMSTWKGAGEAAFKGKCVDSHTGSPIEKFSVKRESENLIQVQTEEGNYKFSVQMTTLNGKKYWNNFKTITTWGPGSETMVISITAKGYSEKQIIIPKNKILAGQDTILDIYLEK
ncbi:MAG: hypothetical protein WC324_02390 [Candidatus Omnitrophota bacterium]|jgi:hypothetical protein